MIFIDSSALFALLVADDAFHEAAVAAWQRLQEEGESLVSTNYAAVESLALLQRRSGMPAVRAAVALVLPAIRSEWITPEQHADAVQTWITADRRKLSLVDIASFAAMRRLGIERAFAFDEHFAEQGFEVLPGQR